MIETDEGVWVSAKPTHAELERAIASVPGVEEAHVTLLPDTGRSRLRIRLANGEDAPSVSWAISATLRERFGIVLDPGAIRPKLAVSETPTPPASETPTPPAGETADEIAVAEQPSASAPPSTSVPQSAPGHPGQGDVRPADPVEPVAGDDRDSEVEGDDEDDPIEGKVVVIGDRVQLNEAARAVLAESLDMTSPQQPLEGTTGPTGPAAEAPQAPGSIRDEPGTAAPEAGTDAEAHPADEEPGGGSVGEDLTPTAGDAVRDSESSVEPAITHRRLWSAGGAPEEVDPLCRGKEAARAAIRHLDTQIDVSDVRVTATLAHGGRSVTGEASSVPTRKGILRAVAEATVSALRQLTGDRLVVGVDSVVASVAGEPPMATVLVGIVTEAGEETLLGSSLVRQDPERAVMRATLDALNRRIEPWLEFDLAG